MAAPATTHRLRRRGGAPGRALLIARLRMARNGLTGAARRRRGRTVLRLAVLAPTVVQAVLGLYAAALTGFRAMASPADDAAVLSTVFAAMAVGGFIGSASVGLQALYLSSDLPFLLTMPIPRRVTYAAKFAEAMVGTLPVAVALAATAAGYGTARAGDWWFAVVALAVGLGLLTMATSLGVVAVAAIARYVPAKRARQFLGLVSLTLVILTWVALSALMPDVAASAGEGDAGEMGWRMVGAGDALAWTPVGWAAETTVAAAGGAGLAPLGLHGALLAASAVGTMLGAFAVFARTFDGGYARLRAAATPRTHGRTARWAEALLRPLPRPVAALVVKEWLTMGRDFRRLSGAVWPLGMVAVYTVVLSRQQTPVPVDAPALDFWLASGSLALVPWGASLGVSVYAFGTERRNIQLLRTLPVAPGRMLLAKTLASLIPVLLLAEAAAVIVSVGQGASGGELAGMVGLVAWATVGYVVVDTAAAAIAPNFEAAHVQRATTLLGRTFGFAAGAIFTVATAAAAGRLILFATSVPASLKGPLGVEIEGVTPLGWPLVVAGAAVAVLTLLVVLVIARDRLEEIVRSGE